MMFVDVTVFILSLNFSSALFRDKRAFFSFRTRFFVRAANIRIICIAWEIICFLGKIDPIFFHVVGNYFNLYNFDRSLKSCLVNDLEIVMNHESFIV